MQKSAFTDRYAIHRWGVVLLLLFSQLASAPGVLELVWHMKGLVRHYHEHSQENQDLTFTDFLRLHYGDLEQLHHDDHDHSGLPFKCQHTEGLVMTGLHFPAMDDPSWPLPLATCGFASLLYRDATWHPAEPHCDIWQPPRFV